MKRFVLMLVLIVTTCSLMAQNNYVPPTKPYKVLVSFFAGPALEWVQPKTVGYDLVAPSLGFRAGVPIEINLTERENFYFTTGIHVKFEHSSLTLPEKYELLAGTPSVIVNTNRKYSNFYLSIPTGIKMKVAISPKSMLGLNLGLYHSLFLSGKTYDEFNLSNISTTDYSITTNLVDNKYGAMFKESGFGGIGYEYKINPNLRAYVYANYVLTFTNFFAPNSMNSVNLQKESAISQGVELLVGIGL